MVKVQKFGNPAGVVPLISVSTYGCPISRLYVCCVLMYVSHAHIFTIIERKFLNDI